MLAPHASPLNHSLVCYKNNSCLGSKHAGYRHICKGKNQVWRAVGKQTSPDSVKTVGGNEDVILKIPGLAGFQMKVKANSVTFPDGSRTGTLIVSPVTADKLPMSPPGGAATFGVPAWTVQPAGTRFDPPIEVTLPNYEGRPAGDNVPIVQWDHDLGQYVAMGRATVSEDGAVLICDSGSGITKAGWGGGPPTPPPKCQKSPPKCKDCEKIDTSGDCPTCAPNMSATGGCDDKDKCTADDKCVGGACKGTPIEIRITAASESICVGKTKQFVAVSKPAGRTVKWSGSGGISVGSSGLVTAILAGSASVTAEDTECTKATDVKTIRVIDRGSFEGQPGEVDTCLKPTNYVACGVALDLRSRIDPSTDQGKPTWVSSNFKSNNTPGECRANREGSEMDAATHAYLSCTLYRDPLVSSRAAKEILDAHENSSPEDTCESHEMDFNNLITIKTLLRSFKSKATACLAVILFGALAIPVLAQGTPPAATANTR